MEWKLLASTFGLVFLAELGDKTQLATLSLSAESRARWTVFLGSAIALVLSSLIAALLGSEISRYISVAYVKTAAGVLFLVMGLWMLFGPSG